MIINLHRGVFQAEDKRGAQAPSSKARIFPSESCQKRSNNLSSSTHDSDNQTFGSLDAAKKAHIKQRTKLDGSKTKPTNIPTAISCAECRRLKLRCDKKIPCSSCVRRGCRSICPIGNPTGVSRKQVTVLDTAALHRKIEEMGQRIRQLEDALSLLQPSHPLLRDEYLRIKFPPNAPEDTAVEKEVSAEVADLADEYGTLTLEEGGRTRYFGRTGVSEVRRSLILCRIRASICGFSRSPRDQATLPLFYGWPAE
ncbi:hypothetical protein PM082_000864 [Marasmius tenuissimus]|nr:hypothetical protein PM082_000864 [Marasmius tenuissimus]